MPRSGLSIWAHSTATATPLRTAGRNKIVRNRYIPRSRRLRSNANAMPATWKRGTAKIV